MISPVENEVSDKHNHFHPHPHLSLLPYPLSLLLNDGLAVEKMTPPGYIYEGRADFDPATLKVDTTANTHVSNDPFLIDWDVVTDFSSNIINVRNNQASTH